MSLVVIKGDAINGALEVGLCLHQGAEFARTQHQHLAIAERHHVGIARRIAHQCDLTEEIACEQGREFVNVATVVAS